MILANHLIHCMSPGMLANMDLVEVGDAEKQHGVGLSLTLIITLPEDSKGICITDVQCTSQSHETLQHNNCEQCVQTV